MRRRLANRRSTILYRKEVKTDDTEVISWVFLLKKLSDERLSISNPLAVCNGLARKGVTHLVPCRFSLHMSMFCTLWWATLCQLEDMLSRLLLGSSNIISSENGLASEAECFVIDWVLLTIYVAHSHFCLKYLSITVSPWYEKSTFTLDVCIEDWFYSTNHRVSLGWRGQRGNNSMSVTRHDACCYN